MNANIILPKLYVNAYIIKTQCFRKMKFDMQGHCMKVIILIEGITFSLILFLVKSDFTQTFSE